MDNQINGNPEKPTNHEATVQERIGSYQNAFIAWQSAEQARSAKAQAIDASTSLEPSSSFTQSDRLPIPKPAEAARWAELKTARDSLRANLDKPDSWTDNGPAPKITEELNRLISDLKGLKEAGRNIPPNNDTLKKQEDAQFKALTYLEVLGDKGKYGSHQAVGEILAAEPTLLTGRTAQEAVGKIVDSVNRDVPNQIALEKQDPRHKIDLIIETAVSPESPLDPAVKEKLTDTLAYKQGYQTMEITLATSREQGSNYQGGYKPDISFGTTLQPDEVRQTEIAKKYGGSTNPFIYPAALAETAEKNNDEKERRRLQLLALGAATFLMDKRSAYPPPTGTNLDGSKLAQTAVAEVLTGSGSPTLLEIKESTAKDLKTEKLQEFMNKYGVPNGDPLDLYNQKILGERNAVAEKAEAKQKQEKVAQEKLAQTVAAEAEAQKLLEQKTQHQAAVAAYQAEAATHLTKQGFFSKEYKPDTKWLAELVAKAKAGDKAAEDAWHQVTSGHYTKEKNGTFSFVKPTPP